MNKCPNCGAKRGSFLLRMDYFCLTCGKTVCEKCGRPLFALSVWVNDGATKLPTALVYVCSEKCWNGFLEEIKTFLANNPPHFDLDTENCSPKIVFPAHEAAFKLFILPYLQEKQEKHPLYKSWNTHLRWIEEGNPWGLYSDRKYDFQRKQADYSSARTKPL